jgi:hypothetical protein
MQNNYSGFHRFDSQMHPQEKGRFKNINKKMLAGGIVVIFAGIMVGGILKAKTMNESSSSVPSGEVQGALTEASFTPSPTDTPGPTNNPHGTPIEISANVHLDSSAEGASPTTIATPTATPTASPTPSPSPGAPTYTAIIKSISGSPASADGNSAITITVSVTKDGASDCGESVYLISDKAGVTFSSDSCLAGDNTFTATSQTPQTYTIVPEVYQISYPNAAATITFNN